MESIIITNSPRLYIFRLILIFFLFHFFNLIIEGGSTITSTCHSHLSLFANLPHHVLRGVITVSTLLINKQPFITKNMHYIYLCLFVTWRLYENLDAFFFFFFLCIPFFWRVLHKHRKNMCWHSLFIYFCSDLSKKYT